VRSTRTIAVAVTVVVVLAVAVCGFAAAFHHPLVPTTVLWIGASIGVGLVVLAVQRDERAEIVERVDDLVATVERMDGTIQKLSEDLQAALSSQYLDGFEQGREGKNSNVRPFPRVPS